MDPNVSILDVAQFVPAFPPGSLTTAHTGRVVDLKGYRRCLVKFYKGIGTAGDDPTITIEQGTDETFATHKALNFSTVYVKQDLTTLQNVGQWTRVDKGSPSSTYTDPTSAEQEALWAVDIMAEDLDVNADYRCIRASIGDAGTNAQTGVVEYILYDPINAGAPELQQSAVV